MLYNWGPHYIVPSDAIKTYSGNVLLREKFDEVLLRRQIKERGLHGSVVRMSNAWFYRKKNSEQWVKIGESSNIRRNFAVRWDTTNIENGQYEIMGFMQAFLDRVKRDEITLANGEYEKWFKPIPHKKRLEKRVIGEQNAVEVIIKN